MFEELCYHLLTDYGQRHPNEDLVRIYSPVRWVVVTTGVSGQGRGDQETPKSSSSFDH